MDASKGAFVRFGSTQDANRTWFSPQSSHSSMHSFEDQHSVSSKSSKDEPLYLITDYVTSFHEAVESFGKRRKSNTISTWQSFKNKIKNLNLSLWILLALSGLLTALVCFTVDFVSAQLIALKVELMAPYGFWTGLAIWTSASIFFGLIAASCGKYISVHAEGSGLPEMKTIMSGVKIPNALTYKTLISKIVGITSVTAASLSIGKEGPFVHIAAIISHKLCKTFYYLRHIEEDLATHSQVFASAIAAGVCATFGAPVGGVLFSIEITSTYYVISYMWKAYYCSIWCMILFAYLHVSSETNLIYGTNNLDIQLDWQIFSFIALGALCGLLGSLIVRAVIGLTRFRKGMKFGWFSNRYQYTVTVCMLCSIISYSFVPLMISEKVVFHDMFYKTSEELANSDWGAHGIFLVMGIYFFAKLAITIISLSCPVPIGIFTTVFTAGAVLGRLWGETQDYFLDTEMIGVYALIGASCMAGAVTHTISVAVIVYELTGQINVMIYMLSSVIMSFAVARNLSCSAYDVGVRMKKLPYLPYMRHSNIYDKKAKFLMDTEFSYLHRKATISDVLDLFQSDIKIDRVPILDNDGCLMADISLNGLRKEIYNEFNRYETFFTGNAQYLIKEYTKHLKHLLDERPGIPYADETLNELKNDRSISEFLKSELRFDYSSIDLDNAPLTISRKTKISKTHYLFLMLGIHHLYVTEKGVLVGILDRTHIIDHRNNN